MQPPEDNCKEEKKWMHSFLSQSASFLFKKTFTKLGAGWSQEKRQRHYITLMASSSIQRNTFGESATIFLSVLKGAHIQLCKTNPDFTSQFSVSSSVFSLPLAAGNQCQKSCGVFPSLSFLFFNLNEIKENRFQISEFVTTGEDGSSFRLWPIANTFLQSYLPEANCKEEQYGYSTIHTNRLFWCPIDNASILVYSRK